MAATVMAIIRIFRGLVSALRPVRRHLDVAARVGPEGKHPHPTQIRVRTEFRALAAVGLPVQ